MAGDGVAVRLLSLAATPGSCGTPDYILQRTVVLNKVEVGGGDRAKRKAEIAHNGDGFQENHGKQHSGAPIEIDASGMHLLHQGAKETEIEVRGGAEGGAVGGAVHVGDIGADGDVHGDGDAKFVSSGQDAGACVGDIDYGVVEELAGSFAVAEAGAHGDFCDLVEVFAGFRGHAEGAGAETGFDVFGSVTDESDFEIVNERGAVHGDGGDKAATHEID